MRYTLRTLMILLALGPPSLAWGWSEYSEYRDRQRLKEQWQREAEEIEKLRSRGYYYSHRMQLDIF